ncbi:MAG: hypothetical protein JNK48_29460 [Bryobacterales bacterium]|nr:hypothetical protein [Bryobacterales bacterium]
MVESLSPDGRTRITWAISEGRMSHEIRCPRITDAQSGEILFDLWMDTSWDASVQWLENGLLRLSIRHYAEGGVTMLDVLVDRGAGVFRMENGPWRPLNWMQGEVPEAYWRKAGSGGGLQSG